MQFLDPGRWPWWTRGNESWSFQNRARGDAPRRQSMRSTFLHITKMRSSGLRGDAIFHESGTLNAIFVVDWLVKRIILKSNSTGKQARVGVHVIPAKTVPFPQRVKNRDPRCANNNSLLHGA